MSQILLPAYRFSSSRAELSTLLKLLHMSLQKESSVLMTAGRKNCISGYTMFVRLQKIYFIIPNYKKASILQNFKIKLIKL